MTHKELVKEVASRLQMYQKHADQVLKTAYEVIKEGVKKDGKVQIADFLTFQAKKVEARKGHNPRTQQELTIPARVQVYVKPGKAFRDFVNGVKAK